MATTRGSASKDAANILPDQQVEWLPPVSSKPLMSNLRVRPFISAQKHHHWWLAFADAIYECQDDRHQGKMVAKMYAFLHDFMPAGLTGSWSHIQGADVMSILLCQTTEMSVSRHKATQNAQSALEHMENWMRKGKNWREAATHAMAEVIKKRGPRKPPVLYKPAAMLALLIIAYPDPKYRLWIGRLQIGWMMGRQDQLDIRSGFWEGLTPADLQMFQQDEAREAEVPLLADYTKMFGDDFVATIKNIRPFLPKWAEGPNALVHVDGEPADVGDAVEDAAVSDPSDVDSSIFVDQPGRPRSPAGLDDEDAWTSNLYQHLNPRATDPTESQLQSFVLDKLKTSSEGDILSMWCAYWVRRMDAARWFEEQAIVRSLFNVSVRVLYNLSKSTAYAAMADAYLLLDMEDGEARSVPSDPETVNSINRLEKLPLYKPFVNAEQKLQQTALDDSRREHLQAGFREQLAFFYELIRHRTFNKHVKDVVKLDTARTTLIKHEPVDLSTEGPVDTTTIKLLKLTKWQLRVLAVSPLDSVLTDWQRKLRAHGAFTFPIVLAGEIAHMHDVEADLRQTMIHLFGDIQTPFAAAHGDVFSKNGDDPRQSDSPPEAAESHSIDALESTKSNTEKSRPHSEAFSKHGNDNPQQSASPSSRAAESHSSDALEHSTKSDTHTDKSRPRSVSRLTTPAPASPHTPRIGLPSGMPSSAKEDTPVTATSWSPFAGRVSAKRACSPDRYPVKAQRRTPSIGDIKTDIITSTERLRDQIAEVTEEKSTWLSKRLAISAEQTEARVLTAQRAIESTVRQVDVKLESLVATVADVQDLGQETDMRVKALMDETKSQQTHAQLKSLTDAIEARDQQTDVRLRSLTDAIVESDMRHRQMEESIRSLTGVIESLRESLSKPTAGELRPGDSGYLTANCQAPSGWDQRSYEAVLLRAGFYYIACLGMPENGVDADHDAFTRTTDKFPTVHAQHLLKALGHAHSMGYLRPFDTEGPSSQE